MTTKTMLIHRITYAKQGENEYRVMPIWQGEALAQLKGIVPGSDFDETGEKIRVELWDLFENYVLEDMDHKAIDSEPRLYQGRE